MTQSCVSLLCRGQDGGGYAWSADRPAVNIMTGPPWRSGPRRILSCAAENMAATSYIRAWPQPRCLTESNLMIASLCPDWMLGNNVICARRIASGLSRLSSHTESPTQLCFLQDSFLWAITIVNRMLQSYEPNHSRVVLTQVLAARRPYSLQYLQIVLTPSAQMIW